MYVCDPPVCHLVRLGCSRVLASHFMPRCSPPYGQGEVEGRCIAFLVFPASQTCPEPEEKARQRTMRDARLKGRMLRFCARASLVGQVEHTPTAARNRLVRLLASDMDKVDRGDWQLTRHELCLRLSLLGPGAITDLCDLYRQSFQSWSTFKTTFLYRNGTFPLAKGLLRLSDPGTEPVPRDPQSGPRLLPFIVKDLPGPKPRNPSSASESFAAPSYSFWWAPFISRHGRKSHASARCCRAEIVPTESMALVIHRKDTRSQHASIAHESNGSKYAKAKAPTNFYFVFIIFGSLLFFLCNVRADAMCVGVCSASCSSVRRCDPKYVRNYSPGRALLQFFFSNPNGKTLNADPCRPQSPSTRLPPSAIDILPYCRCSRPSGTVRTGRQVSKR